MNRRLWCAVRALPFMAALFPLPAFAKPIAFAHGTTVMAEYGAGTMRELQVFYAPRYFLSSGLGHLALDSDMDERSRDITYARLNYLAKRWNLESAQANIFTWGSLGSATVGDDSSRRFAWNAGAQFDFETRRIYSSLKSDYYSSSRVLPSDRHLAAGRRALRARLRDAGNLVRSAGSALHGRDPRRNRGRLLVAPLQARGMDRGRSDHRRESPGHVHAEFLIGDIRCVLFISCCSCSLC